MNCPGCVDVNYVDVDTERQDDAERAANTTPTIEPFVELVCEVKKLHIRMHADSRTPAAQLVWRRRCRSTRVPSRVYLRLRRPARRLRSTAFSPPACVTSARTS